MALYLKPEIRAGLEVTLVQVLSISQLKYASATGLSQASQQLLLDVSSNLLAFRSVKEQAFESPLLESML